MGIEGMSSLLPNNPENSSAEHSHEVLKESADQDALEILAEHGFAEDLKTASAEELTELIEGLPALIDEYSVDDAGNVKNENRYLVRTLANHLEAAKREHNAKVFPSPLAA